jgi:sulfate permease, SulP family
MGTLFRVEPVPAAPVGVAVYRLYGALFFGAVGKVEAVGENLPPGTHTVVLEMHRLVSMDSSGLDAVQQLHRQLTRQGVSLWLCDVNEQPRDLMHRAGFEAVLGAERIAPDLAGAFSSLRRDA